ncbi:hypothetical protein [Vibrio profundi]|uniref:hypothetical protein n=1 Tax=Vibrio profundi TaxID=1774960 RepID=UPI0037360F23
MKYTTYYESSSLDLGQLGVVTLMLAFFLGSIFLFFRAKHIFIKKEQIQRGKLFSIGMGLFTGLLFISSWFSIIYEYNEIMKKYREGDAYVSTGIVKNVNYIVKNGNQESFSINEYTFKYSHNEFTSFFNKTKNIGGPIKEGLPVRVTHYEGQIIKLEISEK